MSINVEAHDPLRRRMTATPPRLRQGGNDDAQFMGLNRASIVAGWQSAPSHGTLPAYCFANSMVVVS